MGNYESLDVVRVAGSGLLADLGPRVTTASLELSASAVTQLQLAVLDPDCQLLNSRVLARGAAVDAEGLKLRVAAEGYNAPGQSAQTLSVDCRPRAVHALQQQSGRRTWTNVSPDGLAGLLAASVDLALTAEPRPKRRQVLRKAEANQPPETSWELLLRLAKEEGCWVWESEGRLYLGRPTWLLATLPMYDVEWWAPGSGREGTPSLLSPPSLRWTDDDPTKGASGTLSMLREQAVVLTPGRGVRLGGSLVPYNGRYIVTSLKLDVGGTTATVSIESPRNPTPEPPAEETPTEKAAATPQPKGTPVTGSTVRASKPVTSHTRAAARKASEERWGRYNPDKHRRFEDGSFRPRKPGEKRDDVVRAEDGSWVSRSFYRKT